MAGGVVDNGGVVGTVGIARRRRRHRRDRRRRRRHVRRSPRPVDDRRTIADHQPRRVAPAEVGGPHQLHVNLRTRGAGGRRRDLHRGAPFGVGHHLAHPPRPAGGDAAAVGDFVPHDPPRQRRAVGLPIHLRRQRFAAAAGDGSPAGRSTARRPSKSSRSASAGSTTRPSA